MLYQGGGREDRGGGEATLRVAAEEESGPSLISSQALQDEFPFRLCLPRASCNSVGQIPRDLLPGKKINPQTGVGRIPGM